MISKVFKNINNYKIPQNAKILCAVSGGVDSVVMLNVLNDFRFDCIVAHCNFKLRGEESDRDERFVRELADRFEMKFLCETFDTVNYAEKTGVSIQMAARDLRYEWFFEMADKFNCDYIALAHNSDDQAETVITNLIRGTGIRGLTGMKFVKDKLFRPLINISRNEIDEFAKINTIDYCVDSTNLTIKYSRNKIRHCIFPLMEEINISYKNNILKSIEYLKDTERIMQAYVVQAKIKCLKYADAKIYINLVELQSFVSIETVLFELLVGEGVPKILAVESLSLLKSQSGKSFSFLNMEILRDRDNIIVNKDSKIKMEVNISFSNENLNKLSEYNIAYNIKNYSSDIEILKDQNYAYIDYDKLIFPLCLRKWHSGDKFRPIGMKSMKKLSDFFSDEKLSMFEKSEVLLLTSGNDIVWVVGYRIDDRFKITDVTQKLLILKYYNR